MTDRRLTAPFLAIATGFLAGPVLGQCQVPKLLASDGAFLDRFGSWCALSPELAVVGAPHDDDLGDYSGSAYLFLEQAGGWVEAAKLLPGDGSAGHFFGGCVAVSGTTVVVGASGHDGAGLLAGAAYVFERQGSTWIETAKLAPADLAAGDRFGGRVAIAGDLIAVGALGHGEVAPFAGAAYLFEKQGGTWVQIQELHASDAEEGDQFGFVSMSESVIVVGAILDDDVAHQAGAAYVFERQGGAWVETAKLRPPVADIWELFGTYSATSGDAILVSAHQHDATGTDSGAAYVFERGASGWDLVSSLVPSDGEGGDEFGTTVAIDSDTAVVGAPGFDGPSSDLGAAYVYRRTPDGWKLATRLLSESAQLDDELGKVALAGDTALLGSPNDDDQASEGGSALLVDVGALCGHVDSVSLSAGGVQELRLLPLAELAGAPYLVLGSVSGSSPGLVVDGLVLPLNIDAYFLATLEAPNTLPLASSFGLLDPQGKAVAKFRLPPGTAPSLAGLVVRHAYLVFEASASPSAVFASGAEPVELVP